MSSSRCQNPENLTKPEGMGKSSVHKDGPKKVSRHLSWTGQ